MEELKAKYKAQIEKIVASKDPSQTDILHSSIAELRFLNEMLIRKRDDLRDTERGSQMRQAFDLAAEEMRSAELQRTKAAQGRHVKNLGHNQRTSGIFAGIASGAVLAVVSFMALQNIGVLDVAFGEDAKRSIALNEQFLSNQAAIPVADSYLKQAVATVVDMQKKDPVKLAHIAGKTFVSLRAINPKLHAAKPKELTRYSDIIVKADKDGYKVLLNWPLCTAAKWTKPDLIDPVRGTVGEYCSHFGYWNAAGSKF